MNTEYYLPKTAYLKSIIHSIWQVKNTTPHLNETILPKGVIEIIFDLGEGAPGHSKIDDRQFQLAKCFINGFNTCPIQTQLPEQHFFFGVQFHPMAIKHFFKTPAGEFSNVTVDLTLLDPVFQVLWHQLAEVKTFAERVTIICKWIESKIIQPHRQEELLNAFIKNNDQHNITIQALAKTICYSPRHLGRKVYELTGMNTEQYLLYKKYLHAVQLIHHTELALTNIAYDCNFSDQAHFTRSFKAFARMTPKEYRQAKSHVPGHIFQEVR